MIHYCKAGDINNPTNYQGEYLDYFYECLPIVSECIYETDPRERFKAANEILVILWEYIKPLIQEAEQREQSGDLGTFGEELAETLGGQVAGGSPLPKKKGRPKDKRKAKIDKGVLQEGREEIQEILQEETGRIALEKTSELSVGSNPGISYNFDYTGSGYEDAANDIKGVLTKLAKDLAELEYEEDLSEELQKESNAIQYGNIHKGIHIYVNRMTHVPDRLKRSYDAVAGPLLDISRRLQQSISEILYMEGVWNQGTFITMTADISRGPGFQEIHPNWLWGCSLMKAALWEVRPGFQWQTKPQLFSMISAVLLISPSRSMVIQKITPMLYSYIPMQNLIRLIIRTAIG